MAHSCATQDGEASADEGSTAVTQQSRFWARTRRKWRQDGGHSYAAFAGGAVRTSVTGVRINDGGACTVKCCLALERKDIPTHATEP